MIAVLLSGAFGACARVDSVSGAGGNMSVTVPTGSGGAGGGGVIDASKPTDTTPVTPPKTCVNLECQQVKCMGGGSTSISGTAFAPNGTLPLYNVRVYIPNAGLDPLPVGVSCDRCGAPASGKPIVTAISDAEGKFRITDVPAGHDIPLVLQVGKWRRQVKLPVVTACQDNPITDANLTRLPRNRTEGDMPKVAVTTGSCDQLGCLLPKLGIDAAEFGIAGEDKPFTYYRGVTGLVGGPVLGANPFGPPNMTAASDLWTDEATLSKNDMTLLSCECSENLTTKPTASFTAMNNYLNKGGRIFGSHYSYVWLKNSPDPALTAAVSIPGGFSGAAASPLIVDTTFPKGRALADWMKFVDPAVTYGEITATTVFSNVRSVMPPAALTWASSGMLTGFGPRDAGTSSDAMTPMYPRILTVNTPAGMPADKQCGRAAHLDAHITDIVAAAAGSTFPEVCGTNLTKGEEALAFLFFDLSSCIQDDSMAPIP